MAQYKNPWDDTANAAVNAMYKYYMSKPSPAQIEQQGLQNELIRSQIATGQAQRDRLATENQLDQRRLKSVGDIANLVTGFYAPTEQEGPRSSPAAVGPMPSVMAAPTQDIVNERIAQGRGDLIRNAANYAIQNPSAIAEVMKSFMGGAGASAEMMAPLMKASSSGGSTPAPIQNFEYFREKFADQLKNMTPQQQANLFNSYVRANQKADLGDQQVFVSGATGAPVATYGVGVAPKSEIDTANRQIIYAPGQSGGGYNGQPRGGDQASTSGAMVPPQMGIQPSMGGVEQGFNEPATTSQVTPVQGDQPSGQSSSQGGVVIQSMPPSPKLQQARAGFSNKLSELAKIYGSLQQNKGIVDERNTRLENIQARVGASPVGRFAGEYTGSPNETLRQRVDALRPLMMNDIRQASEMGARGLDSEKELEFYLKAATDPKNTVQSNQRTLQALNNVYGLGTPDVADLQIVDQLRSNFVNSVESMTGGVQPPIDVQSVSDEELLRMIQ